MRRTLTAALLLSVVGTACGTKVVDLADGSAIQPGAAVPVDAAPRPDSEPSDAPVSCAIKATADGTRCVYCGTEARGCLKCDGPITAASCRSCTWTDRPAQGSCQQCFDKAGKLIDDTCDDKRTDLPLPHG